MAKTAKLSDGTILSFPDETPDEVMDAAVKRHVGETDVANEKKYAKMAAEGMSTPEKMLAGAGAGFQTVGEAIGAGRLFGPEGNRPSAASTDRLMDPLGFAGKASKFGTEVGLTALPASRAASLAARGLNVAGRTLTPMGNAAVQGMTAGAMTSPENQAGGALGGGIGGAAFQKVLGGALRTGALPVPQAPGAERLRQAGVEVSAGQGASPETLRGRTWGAIEEGLAGIPVLGQALARKRSAGQQTWREKAVEMVLPEKGPLPKGPEGTMGETVDLIEKQFGKLYQEALQGKRIGPDVGFEEFVTKAVNDPSRYILPKQREFIDQLIQTKIYSQVRNPAPVAGAPMTPGAAPTMLPQATGRPALPPPGGGTAVGPLQAPVGRPMPPQQPPMRDITPGAGAPAAGGGAPGPYFDLPTLFKAQSDLRTAGHKFGGGNLSEQDMGKLLRDVADESYKWIGRHDPKAGATIEALRKPFAGFSAVREATEKAGGAGAFTPTQLRKAAENQSPKLEEFAKLGEQFVNRPQPPGRGTWPAYAALAGGYMLGGPALTAAGALAIPALGSKLAQRALRGDYAAQQALAKLLRKYPAAGGTSGGVVGGNLSEGRR